MPKHYFGRSKDFGIDGQLDQSLPFGQVCCVTASPFHILKDEVGVIVRVGQQHFGRGPVSDHGWHNTFEAGDFSSFRTKGFRLHR